MKRLLLVSAVSTVVLAACGGSHKTAAHVSVNRPTPHLSAVAIGPVSATRIRAVAAARRREAAGKAATLLRRVVLPSGAKRIQRVPVSRRTYVLRRPGLGGPLVSEFADRYGFWRLQESPQVAVAFVKRHPLPGFDWRHLHEWHGESSSTSLLFPGSQADGHSMQRRLAMRFIPLHGKTVVRIDSEAAWIYPRSQAETLRGDVGVIDIHTLHGIRRVTDPAKIARIIGWFNNLNVLQPGAGVVCLGVRRASVEFLFRSADGVAFASSNVPLGPASGCDPITFSNHGQPQTPLIDNTHGVAFIERVQRALGTRLVPHLRPG